MIRRPPRSTRKESSAASDVYKRQPSNGTLFIEGLERNETIEVVDILGKTLYQNTTSEEKLELNLKLNNGLYFVKHLGSKTPFIIK